MLSIRVNTTNQPAAQIGAGREERMMTMEKILNCPWCGSEAKVDDDYGEFYVSCDDGGCSAIGPVVKTRAAAIAAWNRVAALAEAVKEAEAIVKVAAELAAYRVAAGPLNFQLEKADGDLLYLTIHAADWLSKWGAK